MQAPPALAQRKIKPAQVVLDGLGGLGVAVTQPHFRLEHAPGPGLGQDAGGAPVKISVMGTQRSKLPALAVADSISTSISE